MITLKGMAMGAADVVPGVSGGTIAFISGIYEELIDSIKSFDLTAAKLLFTGRFGQLWKKINGSFLFSLILGISISIFSLARIMTWLLENEPIGIWAFFFGLIIASAWIVGKSIPRWSGATVASLLCGIAVGYLITVLTPSSTPDAWWFVIISGAIAICAMILPGISGAFILLLLGKYAYIMDAVANLRVGTIALFAIGAVGGLISFSHLLSWLLHKWHAVTVAVLTGVMVGSLNKVWPWKEALTFYTDSHGVAHALTERNVMPQTYADITGLPSQLWIAIALCVAGFLLIYTLEGIGSRISKKRGAAK